MDRKALRERLIAAKFPEEIADDILKKTKDEDLVRMKDMSPDDIIQAFKDALAEDEDEDEDEDDEKDTKDPDTTEDDEVDDSAEELAEVFKTLKDDIVAQVKDMFNELSLEVEVPQVSQIHEDVQALKESVSDMSKIVTEMQESWTELQKGDKDRLKEILGNMSPASRNRLRLALPDDKVATQDDPRTKDRSTIFKPKINTVFKPVVRDAQGNEYEDLGALARNQPIDEE